MKEKKITLTEIAARIDAHLKRLERDPTINTRDSKYKTSDYWNAVSRQSGNRVRVCYVSYQGSTPLKREQAIEYLEWLDSGNKGKHWQQQRQKQEKEKHGTSQ